MGARTAADQAAGDPFPMWYIEQVLEADEHAGQPLSNLERKLLHDLLRSRRELEAVRAQLDSVEGL